MSPEQTGGAAAEQPQLVGAARSLAQRAQQAARSLAIAPTAQKDRALAHLAELLESRSTEILAENQADLDAGRAAGLSAALLDRLLLDEKRLLGVAAAVRAVIALPDPVGEITERALRPSGITVARVRLPLGVLLIIYEARPNVTVDAAALCVKSGNAVLLRGGKEARHTNAVLARLVREALVTAGLPADACVAVGDPDRALMLALLQQDDLIDLCIPRGGEALIRFVAEHARVPVIKHYKGVCHVYVDAAADLEMATAIVHNAKCSRPGVCNALECLLVHESVAAALLPRVARRLGPAGVTLRADERALALLTAAGSDELADGESRASVVAASPDDWGREFLDLILAVRVVPSLDAALAHIAQYGSLHTECIVTGDAAAAARFQREVCASCVGWNVSTRFNDGGELGLGAEMGISTTKLHAFGPMGLRELTTTKFLIEGSGQVR